MKHLHRLSLIIAICVAIMSCQKEYSVEHPTGSTTSTSNWSFKEGANAYKGPVDTVEIDTSGGFTVLRLYGHSTDSKDEITLQVVGNTVQAGTYKIPYSLFAYTRNGSLVYQTVQTQVDSFTIVISRLDSTGITGRFSGRAQDTAGKGRTIVDGAFTAAFKSATTASTDSGQVVLWSKAGCGGNTTSPISVSINGHSGQITSFLSAEPSTCDPAGSWNVKLPAGTYPWVAVCGTDSVKGTVTVTKGGCSKIQVDFSAAGTYFPVTAYSNWSYLYEGLTPADTLYTLSTPVSKTFNSNSYHLFTNQDATGKDTSWYRVSGSKYYEYLPAQTSKDTASGNVITLTIPAFEYPFLVDNLAAGATFGAGPFTGSAVISGVPGSTPIAASVNSTVLEVGASANINGVTYTNIIKVKAVYSITYLSQTTATAAVEQWFAKNIGLVKYIEYSDAPAFTTPDYVQSITRAKVY